MKTQKLLGVMALMLMVGSTVVMAEDVTNTTETNKVKVTIEQREEKIQARSDARQAKLTERGVKITDNLNKLSQVTPKTEDQQVKIDTKISEKEATKVKIETVKANNLKVVELKKQILDEISKVRDEIKAIKASGTDLTDEQKSEIAGKVDSIKAIKEKMQAMRDEIKAHNGEKKGLDTVIERQNIRITALTAILNDLAE